MERINHEIRRRVYQSKLTCRLLSLEVKPFKATFFTEQSRLPHVLHILIWVAT